MSDQEKHLEQTNSAEEREAIEGAQNAAANADNTTYTPDFVPSKATLPPVAAPAKAAKKPAAKAPAKSKKKS